MNEAQLIDAGFSSQEVKDYINQQSGQLLDAGFSQEEVMKYNGIPTPDMEPFRKEVKQNIQKASTDGKPLDFMQALEAGAQMSTAGLVMRGKAPSLTPTGGESRAARVGMMAAQTIGDIPAMTAGYIAGGANPITGTAGAFALPAGLRATLMDGYTKGDFKSFGDFWDRAKDIVIEEAKVWVTGAATGAAGIGAGVATKAAPAVIRAVAPEAAEIAAMTTVGPVLNGEVPKLQDFEDASVMLFGLKAAKAGASKFIELYKNTGVKPEQAIVDSKANPTILQDVAAEVPVPKAYAALAESNVNGGTPSELMRSGESKTPSIMSPKDVDLSKAQAPSTTETMWKDPSGILASPDTTPRINTGSSESSGTNENTSSRDYHTIGSVKTLLKTAEEVKPSIDNFLFSVTKGIDGAEYYGSRVKDEGSVNTKIEAGRNPNQVSDYLGARVVVNTPDAMKSASDAIQKNVGVSKYENLTEENRADGYRAIHMQVETTKGMSVELQVVPKQIMEAQKEARPLYEKWKEFRGNYTPEQRIERLADAAKSKAIYDKAWAEFQSGTKEGTAQERILSKINKGGSTPPSNMTWDKVYTAFVDDLHPINQITKEMGGENVSAAENPYVLSRLTRGSSGRAQAFLESGPFDFKTYKTNARAFKDIISQHKDDLNGFRAYLLSKRALNLEERGITSGLNAEDAKAVVASGSKYEKAAKQLDNYQTATLKYLKDSGVLSEEAFSAMKAANKDYVPFFRYMEDKEIKGVAFGRNIGSKNPIKKIKGSERDIIDPLESIVRNTYSFVDIANKNEVIKAFYDLANKSKDPSQFYELAKAPKIDGEKIEGVPTEASSILAQAKAPLAKGEIAFFDNGVRTVLKVDPEVATAFQATGNRGGAGLLAKILSVPASLLRAGATITPDFTLRNIQRDQLTAFVNSKGKFLPFFSMAKGLAESLKQGEAYQNWLKGGGAHGTMVSLDRDYIQSELYKLIGEKPETNFLDKTWNIVKKPVDVLRMMSELGENATRIGGFMAENPQSKAEILKGAYDARELTLDFSRRGAQIKAINMITAFFNVGIQGPDKMVRTIKDNPLGTMASIAVSTTIPSVLLWYANHDDPRYKELPAWQRDLFHIVMTKDHIYRIPKSFETGILFGSGVERMLDAVTTGMDKRDLQQYVNNIVGGITPNFIPTFAQPVLEQMTNYSFFGGHSLVPASLEKMIPEYQYTEYTSELTKAVGSIVGFVPGVKDTTFASPIVLDNYLKAWTGGMGNYALQLADASLRKAGVLPDPVKATSTLADIPVIKAFVVRFPSASAESIQRFRDDYAQRASVFYTIKELVKQGNAGAAIKLAESNPAAMSKLDDLNTALGQSTQLIHMININPEITPDEKRQIIDSTYYNMIEMTRAGNDLMKAIDEEQNGNKKQ